MSRSLKTEALSILLLRLRMYIMLMSRSLKEAERETYYITAIQHAYYVCVSFFKNRSAKHAFTAIEYVYNACVSF